MKVIIEDVVLKMAGGAETELPEGTSIRFEMGTTSLSCKITEHGLSIYKIDNVIGDGEIIILPHASNKIYIK